MGAYLAYIDAASTPLLAALLWIVWRVKANDLPHIQSQISELHGMVKGVELERIRKNNE